MADRLEERHPELEAAEFEAERPARELSGLPKLVVSAAAVAVSLYALYWVVAPQPAQPYRTSFLAVTLAMTLLAYRPLARGRAATDEEPEAGGDNPGPLDWALAALALVVLLYPLLVFDDFARRVVRPTGLDVVLGVVAVLLVLEATRRTVGWVLPAICLAFVAYAFFGDLLPFGWELGHKGYDLERLVGQTYMGIEGIFGVPLDVAATYIVLFTIYGAVLEFSGAGRFFIDDFYISAEIEAGRYDGVDQPVKVVAVPNYLVVNRSMDPELAYRLTKLLFDQKAALAEVHPSARRLELDTAPKVAPLELHPGARRYYDEQART